MRIFWQTWEIPNLKVPFRWCRKYSLFRAVLQMVLRGFPSVWGWYLKEDNFRIKPVSRQSSTFIVGVKRLLVPKSLLC